MIEIRKLAALELAWAGAPLIVAEYVVGVVVPLGLGLLSFRAALTAMPEPVIWQAVVGLWLLSIGANYVPLLVYAVAIARGGSAASEGRPEIARVARYRIQQLMLLAPLLVVIAAAGQELRRAR